MAREIGPRRSVHDDRVHRLVFCGTEEAAGIMLVNEPNGTCQSINLPWAMVEVLAEELPRYKRHCGK